jgi:rRNA maturation endonuclease Nob1
MGDQELDKMYSVKLRCENCGKIFTTFIEKGNRINLTSHSCPNCNIVSRNHQLVSSGLEILSE